MTKNRILPSLLTLLCLACQNEVKQPGRAEIAQAMEASIQNETLAKWYPRSVDSEQGGFLSAFTFDFQPAEDQRKMIVTQARHTWTNAKAAIRYPDVPHYKDGAVHGFDFLRDFMWDKQYGGFYWMVNRDGTNTGQDSMKTAYGNAFGIYALAAYYEMSQDEAGLALAKEAFQWMEHHSHDPVAGGYFQHLRRDGTPIKRDASTPSTADTGYKDQNSSIHLLEAFTELYQVWPDKSLRQRLQEMLFLIRDKIVTEKGYLTLFLQPDLTPVTFRDSSQAVIMEHRYLDHVSFGHDVETAFLMLEASHVLELEDDVRTATIAKKMVDHALMNGWDAKTGGFYDEAYYFKGVDGITTTRDTKNWWAQAEGMNTLLMMSDLYPDDPLDYYGKFELLWNYVNTNLIDHVNGDWFAGGIDRQPELRSAMKGHIWKACYHQYRSMVNCIDRLED